MTQELRLGFPWQLARLDAHSHEQRAADVHTIDIFRLIQTMTGIQRGVDRILGVFLAAELPPCISSSHFRLGDAPINV